MLVPFGSVRKMTFSNSSTEVNRPSAVTCAVDLLAFHRRTRAERSGGELHVLPAHAIEGFGCRHAISAQLVGIEPDAHAVGRAELRCAADALDALHAIEDLRRDDVLQLLRGNAVVLRANRDRHQEIRIRLGDRDALLNDLAWQSRRGECHAVLRLHGRDVGIRAGFEGQRDAGHARGTRRGEIQHVVDAGELLLDNLRDGAFDGFGIGARDRRQ